MTNAPFAPGDLVLVVGGPFASFKGIVKEVDAAHDEASLEVTMFGQPTPLRAEFGQLERRR